MEHDLKARRPTVLDVANRARVSVGTVSNVLNGRTPVSEQKQQRVRDAIAELSYTQNLLAKGLRRHRSALVGLCVPHTSVAYFAKLVEAFEDAATSRDFEILQTLSHEDPATEHRRIASLLNHHVSGLILVPSFDPSAALDAVARSGTPMVVVDRPVAGRRFDQVTFDNHAAMRDAAERLIALGHRSILFVVRFRQIATTQLRIAALQSVAQQAGVAVTVLECRNDDDAQISAGLRTQLTQHGRPTAIIVSNSVFAACIVRVLRELRIRCPDDVSLLAFDQPDWADLVAPRLSVVEQPTRDIARLAWELLVQRMGDETRPIEVCELPAAIVLDESVSVARTAPRGAASEAG